MSEQDYDQSIDIISETPEYSPKSEFNKPKMVETVLNRCLELRSKSMHPSYVNTSVSTDGTIKREHVDDSRQAYVNAVKAALVTLTAELNRSNRLDKVKELLKKEEELFEQYAYEDREHFAKRLSDGRWEIKKVPGKFIPENDQIVGVDQVETRLGFPKGMVIRIKGYRNQQTNSYWLGMITISDNILSQLQCLVDELNYFKQSSTF